MSDANARARFRATIEYDGTAFHGSQLQPDVRTVQGEIEGALSRLRDEPARVELAGRTDTGVHATAQEIAFEAPGWDAEELRRALTAVLPADVRILGLERARDDFHPRFDAKARRYEYLIAPASRPGAAFLRDRCWLIPDVPDVRRLGELANGIPGERSFGGFAKSGQPERGTRCRVEGVAWREERSGGLRFLIVADRFLHHMVRYLVGTMTEIATGRRRPGDLELALDEEAPSRPVYPAPAPGLYLTGVRYGEGWNRPAGIPWLDGPGDDPGHRSEDEPGGN